jgi:hypothetical protein
MSGKGTSIEEVLTSIFGGEESALRAACAGWLASSRSFRAFAEENAAKIRKKARLAGDAEGLRDLQLELDTAYRLLADRRVALVYERYLAEKTRGPDLTATFKGHVVFNVEVRRLRAPVAAGKLAEVIAEKLRQLPPGAINVVLLGVDGGAAAGLDPAATMKWLVQRAEAKQEDFFAQRGFRDARDFLRALQRLSGVLVRRGWDDESPATSVLWLNPQARHPLPADTAKLLHG